MTLIFVSVRETAVSAVPFVTVTWPRHARSLQRGIDSVVWQDQTLEVKKTTVIVAPIYFIFAQKYLDKRDSRPQNTYVSSDK